MAAPEPNPPAESGKCGPWLVYVILAIIVLGIAAFLVLRPTPEGSAPRSSPAVPSQK